MLHAGELTFTGFFIAGHLLSGGVVQVGTKCRDFNDFMLAAPAIDHVDDAKTPPDDEGAAKQGLHLLGRGVGSDVKVFGAQAQQQIAHRAAHHIGDKTSVLQSTHHIGGPLIDQGGVDAVGFRRHIHAFTQRGFAVGTAAAGGLGQQVGDKFFDHKNCGCAGACVGIRAARRL